MNYYIVIGAAWILAAVIIITHYKTAALIKRMRRPNVRLGRREGGGP